jgi:hypothetical protein
MKRKGSCSAAGSAAGIYHALGIGGRGLPPASITALGTGGRGLPPYSDNRTIAV